MVAPVDFPCAFNLRYSPELQQFLFTAAGRDGSSLVLTSTPVTGGTAWHHIFVSVDTNAGAGGKTGYLWIDGDDALATKIDADDAFTMGIHGSNLGVPLSLFSKPGGARHTDGLSPVEYADVQLFLGTTINPSETAVARYVFNTEADTSRLPNPQLVRDVVQVLNGFGIDPRMGLTYMGIESAFGRPKDILGLNNIRGGGQSQYVGIFQFNQAEINEALNSVGVGPGNKFDSNNQLITFDYFWNRVWPAILARQSVDDPTGVYRYLIHNQGAGAVSANKGFWGIVNALAHDASGLASKYTTNGFGQAWSGGLGRSSTITQWWNALVTYWNGVQNGPVPALFRPLPSVASLLTTQSLQHIKDFINDGNPVDTFVPELSYNVIPDILLHGRASDFVTNNGTGGEFANSGAITDAETSPPG